jgi:hypothetical protein
MDWIVKYWVEWAFGIVAAIILLLFKKLNTKLNETKRKDDAIELGIQALLRAQMIADYNHYNDKGTAPIYARENFENVYQQYKNLGGNGVMTDIHSKFMALPTPKGEDK